MTSTFARGAVVLDVQKASKIYRSGDNEVVALDDLSLQLKAGAVTGVMGPSGSGKTTFLMIAGLLERPTYGEVRFDGSIISDPKTELNRLRDFRRTKIGFVFQKGQLIPFLTALENVQVAMEINDLGKKAARERAHILLDRLGAGHRLNNYPSQLSGGEQQRVSIARALANGPLLILADEPTAALDAARGNQVMKLFRELADEQNVAICVVTHDPRWASFFNSIVYLEDGHMMKSAIHETANVALDH